MELTLDPATTKLRDEIRAFIAQRLPTDMSDRIARGYHPSREDMAYWMGQLHERGWAAPHWPTEYGGTEWTPLQRFVFDVEMAAADAPPRSFFAVNLVGPVIYTFGSEEQKARFLAPSLRGDLFWCQGFSEPDAGSDLASLRTRAVRDGDDYIISGRKIWTTEAHHADWMFALVKTDARVKPQAGISFVLIDMRSPGAEVRAIETLEGQRNVNEVLLDEVRVPAANLVGQEGAGWGFAKFLLANERTASAEVPNSKRDLAKLKAVLNAGDAGPIVRTAAFRTRVAELDIDLIALESAVLAILTDADSGQTAAASVLKVRGSEIRQRVSELLVEALGDYAMAYYPDPSESEAPLPPGPKFAPGVMGTYLYRRAATIYGGANEVQRNIIARSVLGL
jgi:alkylation response protein AidB-like acyl-CoA dehydrogenase